MLEVENLTKIFRSDKKEEKIALDNVSFKLPSKGLAFIIGKSGSGKTTLLSLIGGLDDITSGDIIYNGNRLKCFKHNEFDVYRNNEVGFIFQDYHLIEDLTIFDNIKMMLDFKNILDDERIYQALEAVGLKGYQNRYPKELSGGEKQRVAIARIIVKNPSIILADEPTGNLDRKTTLVILDLLKKISSDKLVLVVSHNKYDAYEYGDYILKLDDGKIKEKYIKNTTNKKSFRVDDNVLFIAKDRHLLLDEKKNLIESLKKEDISDIKQSQAEFIPYEENINEEAIEFKNKKNHISFLNSLKYSFKFFKKGISKSLILALVVGILIAVSSLCYFVEAINKEEMTKKFINDTNLTNFKISQSDIIDYLDMDIISDIKSKASPSYINTGYIHPVINMNLSINPFSKEGNSNIAQTLIFRVDEAFLIRKFGINNKLEFICKRANEQKDGFYVTDALLDIINNHYTTKEEYKEIVENGYHTPYYDFNVNGIIKTDIYDRYSSLLSKVNPFDSNSFYKLSRKDKDQYCSFVNELFLYHNAFYTYNDNFYNDIIENSRLVNVGLPVSTYNFQTVKLKTDLYNIDNYDFDFNLNNNEIIIDFSSYYNLTGSNETFDLFSITRLKEPIEIDVSYYYFYDILMQNKISSKTLKVVGVTKEYNFANTETIKDIHQGFNKPKSIYLEDCLNRNILNDINEKYDTNYMFIEAYNINKITMLVSSLSNFFIFVLVVLVIVTIFLVILYFVKSFNHQLFEIGVMKSLGARDLDIINMMLIDFIVTLFLTIIIFIGFFIPLIIFSNNVLFEGIIRVTSSSYIRSQIKILYVNKIKVLLISILVCINFYLIYISQFIRIRKLKPINIIKAKE